MSEPGILPEPIPYGKYYLLERINVGGMAEIYKAKAFGVEGFERLLAIKKILDNIAEDESFIDMFIDEAKIAGQLNHPNIAQIFDLGQVDGSYFIALEYISGKDLKTQFERSRRIGEEVSIPQICYIIMKVCEGLGHAHDKTDPQGNDLNIVHRDVSPQNILVSYEGEVKIIDFGIAKAQGKTSQTQVGILKGKFSYMSPEQVRGLHVDHRSDIFSLGIVLYEMLTLERLFLGESDFDTLEKIRKVEMSPPSLYNPHIPKELEDIVLKALARSPEDRYQSAYELAEDLEQFMRNEDYYYTNKDLAAYMKEAFQADIEFEQKKLEYYRSLDLQPLDSPDDESTPDGDGLAWGDEEMETQIYTRDDEDDAGDVEIDETITEEDIVYAGEADEVGTADSDADIVYADDAEPIVGDGAGDDEVTQIHVPGVSDDADGGGAADEQPPTSEFERWDDELQLGDDESDPGDSDIEVEPRRDPEPTAQVSAVDTPQKPQVKVPKSTTPPKESGDGPARGLRIGLVAALIVAMGLPLYFVLSGEEPAAVTFDFGQEPVVVTVDDEVVHEGATPFDTEFPAGDVEIRVEREDHEPFTTTETFEAGQAHLIEDELHPLDFADTGIDVTTTPEDATVYVDDEQLDDPTPAEIRELKPDRYQIRVEHDGFHDETDTIDVEFDEVATAEFELQPTHVDLTVRSYPDRSSYTIYDDESDERLTSGYTSDTITELDAEGTYRVVVDRNFYESATKTVEPDSDPEIDLTVELSQDEEALAQRRRDRNTGSAGGDDGARADTTSTSEPDPQPEPAAEPAGTGSVFIQSRPAARIFINGEDTGEWTPMRGHELPAGSHQITLVNEDHDLNETYSIELDDGDQERVINR